MRLIDISRPVRAGMPVWPGDAPCSLGWTSRMADGAVANAAELHMSVHTATHVDGPYHVLARGARVGELPMDPFVGPAFLVEVPAGAVLTEAWAAALLQAARPERLLVRTGCWVDPSEFPASFPAPTAGAARVLVDAGLRLYGTDAPSVDRFEAERLEVHEVFCEAGTAIIENLLLDGVAPGTYELIALPLRLEEADASPVRAVLRGG